MYTVNYYNQIGNLDFQDRKWQGGWTIELMTIQQMEIDSLGGQRACARLSGHGLRGGCPCTYSQQGSSADPFQEICELSSPGANSR
jgi:hypothetical protein